VGGGTLRRGAAALRLGSDWPHPPAAEQHKGGAIPAAYRDLSYDRLVEDFIAALPSPALAGQILRDNPARLYGF